MIKIDDVIVSDEVLEKKFICDINSCMGQCCVKAVSYTHLTLPTSDLV